jgi:ATP-dependent RNA helicase DDX3X
VETSGENVPEPIEMFLPDMLGPELMRCTELCGYTKPTPVQKYSIPIGITGRDLMACAQTGSGKTAGFLFPTLISLLRSGPPEVRAAAARLRRGAHEHCRPWHVPLAASHWRA